MYSHQKSILEQLTQDEDTKRVRQICPGEKALSVYDFVTGPTSRFAIQSSKGGEMRAVAHGEMLEEVASPYVMYNEADAAEDEVLFARGRDQGLFRPITSPAGILESSRMTQTMVRYGASLLDGADMKDMDEDEFGDNAGKTKALLPATDGSGEQHFIHSVPRIWRDAYFEINRNLGTHGKDRQDMLDRLDFFAQRLNMSGRELQELGWQELMERDRSYGTSYHCCPGANA